MANYDLEDELVCDECDESYLVAYSETSPDAMFCPFCGFEAEVNDEDNDEGSDSYNDRDASLIDGE